MLLIFTIQIGNYDNLNIIWDKDDQAMQFIVKDKSGKVVNSFKLEKEMAKKMGETILAATGKGK